MVARRLRQSSSVKGGGSVLRDHKGPAKKGPPDTTPGISSHKGQLKTLHFKHWADAEPRCNSPTGKFQHAARGNISD